MAESKIIPTLLEHWPLRSSREDGCTVVSSKLPSSNPEYNSSSSSRDQRTLWDVGVQPPSERQQSSKQSTRTSFTPKQPARLAGGSGYTCCPRPSLQSPVESCLPGLHQKYVDVYDSNTCKEGHLPAGYRRFVEHDDLYLPLSQNINPASTNCERLFSPREYFPQDCCPCDLRLCDSDVTYGDIYLPPSRPCTPAFPLDSCRYPPPSSCPPLGPLCQSQIQCTCPPHIKKLAADPSRSCSCAPYIKTMTACSVEAKSPRNCVCLDPRCATCDCQKPKCPPSSVRTSCTTASPTGSPRRPAPLCNPYLPCAPPSPSPCSAFDDVHKPKFQNFQSTSPRCKDCDCHKPKNCKLSSQICKFCRGSGYGCENQTREQQPSSPSSPKSMETLKLPHDKEHSKIERSMNSKQVKGLLSEDTYQSDYEHPTKITKVEFDSSCTKEFELKSMTLATESQSKGLQPCGNGYCQPIHSELPMHADCPFCKHGQSCCCDTCSSQVSTYPHKSSYALDGLPPQLASMSIGGPMGSCNATGLYEPKSGSQAPRKKRDVISPDKYTFRYSPVKATSNAKVRLPSPRRRTRPSQQQSPRRR